MAGEMINGMGSGMDERMVDNGRGLGDFRSQPNSSMMKLDKSRAREVLAEEEAIRADERAREEDRRVTEEIDANNRRIAANNQALRGFEEGLRRGVQVGDRTGRGLTPADANTITGNDTNALLARGLQEGSLDPAMAMQALRDPEALPEIKNAINESLMAGGRQSGTGAGLGSL